MNASGCNVDKNKVGRPRSERIAEALRRVAAGETVVQVARAMGIKNSQQLYNAVRHARERQQSDTSG